MTDGPDRGIAAEAEKLINGWKRKEPLLSGHTHRVLLATAYYIKAASLGRRTSLLEAAALFDVDYGSVQRCFRRIAPLVGLGSPPSVRSTDYRQTYDICAEILTNPGETIGRLMNRVRATHPKLKECLALLEEKGLLTKRLEGGAARYLPTRRGREYLKAYSRLRALLD
ncbi:MAG: hypothetical protein LYZ70_06415 [Nitrososphaerales archaeon]|nr:hypothetical protein [Nitrososphaerales archaeon]